MRLPIALAALSLATVAAAQPTVQYVDVPGVPYDAQISDAGLFAVATSTTYRGFVRDGGAWEAIVPDAGVAPAAGYVSAFFDLRGCLSAYGDNRHFRNCDGLEYLISSNDIVERLRHTTTGAAYSMLFIDGIDQGWAFNTGFSTTSTSWTSFGGLLGSGPALSALRHGTVDYGAWVTQSGASWTAFLSVDGGVPASTTLGFANVREVHAYSEADGELGVLFATDSDLRLASFHDGGATLTTPSVVLSGVGPVTGVSFTATTGDAFGNGFGMAVVEDGGVARIYSPIPDPARPGQLWVPHGNSTLASGAFRRVTCNGARECVITTSAAGTQNVAVYENAFAPRVEPFVVELDEDAAPVVFRLDAGDPDGDPIHVTWAGAPTGAAFFLDAGTDPQGLAVTVSPLAGIVCGTAFAEYPLGVSASDGWSAHTTHDGGVIRIRHTVAPLAPALSAPASVPSGGDPVTLTATAADAGCAASAGLQWTEVTSTGYRLDVGGTGSTATFHPPDTVCAPATVQYRVVASDGVLQSNPATVELQVQPWGKPDAAYPEGATVTHTAGTRVDYAPAATHQCGSTSGFPGVQTTWSFAAGQLAGAVVDVGGTPVSSGVVAPQVGLFAPDCQDGTFVLGATNTVVGSGAVSAPSTLTVNVVTQLVPVSSATVALSATPDAGGSVSGAIDSSANCETERGLRAELVVVEPTSGTELSARATFPVPSDYVLGANAPCSGGAYAVRAQLVEADGGRGSVEEVPVLLPSRPALLSEVKGDRLLATCGGGARATVTAGFEAGSCETSAVAWQQLSGPALDALVPGPSTTLQTTERGFGELIGSEVVLRASTHEGGLPSSRDVTLRIEVDPFVRVVHETEAPLAEEGGILGVRVRLTNDTDCDVSGVTVREALHGLRLVPGTVKVNGVPQAAQVEGETLLVPDITLAARGSATVVYSARPALLSRARPVVVAEVNGVKVSPEQGLPEAAARCGCGATSGGTMLAGTLLLLLQRFTRRRRLTARS